MLSQTAQYAIHAILYIAEHGANHPVSVAEMAAGLDVPRNYLSKTLHQLSRAGIVTATFGPGGGFQLAYAPHQLTLDAIVTPFDESRQQRFCLLGNTRCSDETACPAHEQWKGVSEQIRHFFTTTTVASLLASDGAGAPLLSAPPRQPAPMR